tara:strand:- start:222 stop:332 length:111 start_codon:yes stop_codon:yes gene_type:complete
MGEAQQNAAGGRFFSGKKNPELRMGREKFGVQGLNR